MMTETSLTQLIYQLWQKKVSVSLVYDNESITTPWQIEINCYKVLYTKGGLICEGNEGEMIPLTALNHAEIDTNGADVVVRVKLSKEEVEKWTGLHF